MSAAAHVTQLLGRSSKVAQVRDSILALVRDGTTIEQARRRQAAPVAGSTSVPRLQTDGLLRLARL
jgi:hypothetical protein